MSTCTGIISSYGDSGKAEGAAETQRSCHESRTPSYLAQEKHNNTSQFESTAPADHDTALPAVKQLSIEPLLSIKSPKARTYVWLPTNLLTISKSPLPNPPPPLEHLRTQPTTPVEACTQAHGPSPKKRNTRGAPSARSHPCPPRMIARIPPISVSPASFGSLKL